MKILNIHGYKGTPLNAAYSALSLSAAELISPEIDYDAESMESILQRLTDTCVSESCRMIAGTSLGGFFALLIAIRLNRPVLLVNPCLKPEAVLPGLGYTGDTSFFTAHFSELDRAGEIPVRCVVGDSDEVIGSHDITRSVLGENNTTTVAGGMHSGATLGLECFFPELVNSLCSLQK